MVLFGSLDSWWSQLVELQQSMFIIAAVTTLFLLIQIVLMIIGLGDDDSFDVDTSVEDVDIFNDEGFSEMAGLKLVSVRTVIAFICIGSWGTFMMLFWMHWILALLLGIIMGAAAAYGVAYAMKAAMKLQSEGNIRLENSIGMVADVYLTIPALRQGNGKVNILVQDSFIEREALTDNDTPIKTGAKVKIIDILNQSIVIVAPLTSSTANPGTESATNASATTNAGTGSASNSGAGSTTTNPPTSVFPPV